MKASAKLLPVPVAGGGAIVDIRQSEKYPIDPAVIEKLRYVPCDFAEEKVREVSGDLQRVKNHYNSYIAQLNEYNNKIFSDTQRHYETYILDLKKKARSQFSALETQHQRHQNALQKEILVKEAQMEELRDETASRISTFQDNIRKLKQDHASREAALVLSQHQRVECRVVLNELVAHIYDQHNSQKHQASVMVLQEERAAVSGELARQCEISESLASELQHENQICTSLATQLTVENIIHNIETQHQKDAEQSLLWQIESLKSDMCAELHEVQRGYETRLQQVQQQNDELQTQKYDEIKMLQHEKSELEQRIEQLNSERNSSTEALRASELSLADLHTQYDNIQTQLAALGAESTAASTNNLQQRDKNDVEHTVELLVRDVEITVLIENAANVKLSLEEATQQQQLLQAQIVEVQEKLIKEQTVTAALNVQISELQANLAAMTEQHSSDQQQLKDQILFMTQQPQTNVQPTTPLANAVAEPSVSVSTTSPHSFPLVAKPSRAPPAPVVITLPSPEYQTCQDQIQKLLDRISEVETRLDEQKAEMDTQSALKLSTKNEIKVWMKEFEKVNGHAPDNEEKAVVKDKFIAHKQASAMLQTLQADVTASTEELEALQQELDELQNLLCSLPPTIEEIQQDQQADEAQNSANIDDAAIREAIAAKEQENIELRRVRDELSITAQHLESDNARLSQLVETIKAEKRTDVIARYEKEAEELTERIAALQETISTNRVEKVKLETRIKELSDRIAIADAELEARDARDKAQLTADEEKRQMQGQITKQREEIVLKSKVATAGWDACADAEEKLDNEVDKAYSKGLAEGRKKAAGDLTQLNQEVENKETRIVQLLQEVADMNGKLESLAIEKEQAVASAIEAATRQAELTAAANNFSHGNGEADSAELESLREELVAAQEETASLMDRVDELERQLDVARKRMSILEQMAVTEREAIAAPVVVAAATFTAVIDQIRNAITRGTKLWKDNKKEDCYTLYNDLCASLLTQVPPSARTSLESAIAAAKEVPKQRGAVPLRKALDAVLKMLQEGCDLAEGSGTLDGGGSINMEKSISSSNEANDKLRQQLRELDAQTSAAAAGGPGIAAAVKTGDKPPIAGGSNAAMLKRAQAAEAMVAQLKKQLESHPTGSKGSSSVAKGGSGGVSDAESKKMQKKIAELEAQLSRGGGDNAGDKKALAAAEKKFQKQIKEMEVAARKEKGALDSKVSQLETAVEKLTESSEVLTNERDELKKRVKELGNMSAEMETLRSKAEMVEQLRTEVTAANGQIATLTDQYKKESQLRKKYKNELEDLKGAIRVYARVRPMAQYEKDRNCQSVVQFLDETSLRLTTGRGDKDFEFDAAFNEFVSQEQVFEDTKRLVESCVDGFNVCLFAYGQTGSGKTFTMTGTPDNPGLTPRAIEEMFRIINTKRDYCTSRVTTYFIELYNDNLVDLYWLLDNKRNRSAEPPKLDIKMDAKKMVFIKNSVIKDANSVEELMELFRLGNAERHVGATKMNAESSRSHSIFAIMIETYDKTTKKTAIGKLSLVDLAGSERADKTGAGAERLREAQSINKSLSALGDVIAALSEGEKFIPYRNNKLTQVMQDSLGGNAKTLMFVNFSPADYNSDETATSLTYATRVKKITNNAAKQAESEEVARLKAMIKKLQGGGGVEEEDQEA